MLPGTDSSRPTEGARADVLGLREAWGDRAAFLFGWQALLVLDPGVTAALATGLTRYLVVVWPAARGSERLLAVGLIWVALSQPLRALAGLVIVLLGAPPRPRAGVPALS